MKQIKLLLVLLAATLISQPAFAGTKINAIKKVGKVGLHSAEVAIGLFFIDDILNTFWPFQYKFRYATDAEGWRKWTDKIKAQKALFIIEFIGVRAILAEGFRGLDRELHLVERCTKLINRVRKRKQVRTV